MKRKIKSLSLNEVFEIMIQANAGEDPSAMYRYFIAGRPVIICRIYREDIKFPKELADNGWELDIYNAVLRNRNTRETISIINELD